VGSGYAFIASGRAHNIAVKTTGALMTWGDNAAMQTWQASDMVRSPQQIGTDFASASAGTEHSLAAKTDGSMWAWGANTHGNLGDGTTTNRYPMVLVIP
jgi:alpha-tubulin suppressor-like RCC1 family protein